MATLENIHLEDELQLKATKDADTVLFSTQFVGTGAIKGDSQLLYTMDIKSTDFTGTLTFEEREVQGVSYTQNPVTNEWEIDDTDDSEGDSFSDLVPEGMVATAADTDILDGNSVYRITGTVPDDPEQELVVLWVGTGDLLVRQIKAEGNISADDYEGLIPQELKEVHQSQLFILSKFNEPVDIVAPQLKATPTPTPGEFKQYTEPPSMIIDPAANYIATILTNMGEVVIELFPAAAPKTVNNFVFLANEGFYDDVIFHRVIEDFMIQGGDPTGTGGGGPGYSFEDEIDPTLVFDSPGLLAMANAGPDTNGSQFFITVAPTPHLNGAHTIFGQVLEGKGIADTISKVPADASGRPTQSVTIHSIEITKTGAIHLQSLSDSRAVPMSLLTITASGFDFDSDLQVRFFDEQGYSVDVPAASVDLTSLTVSVPPFIDFTTGEFGPGVVDLRLVQKSTTDSLESNTVSGFQIEDLPSFEEPTGTITLAYFDAIIQLFLNAKEHLTILERFVPGESASPELIAILDEQRAGYVAAKNDVEAVIADPGISVEFAQFGDDTLALNITPIAIMDRLIGSVVQQALSSPVEGTAMRIGNGHSALVVSNQELAQIVPVNFVTVQTQPENPVEESLSLTGLDLDSAIQKIKTWGDSAGTMLALDGIYHKSWAQLPKDPVSKKATGGVVNALSALHYTAFTVVPAIMTLVEDFSAITAATNKEVFEQTAPLIGQFIAKVGPGLVDTMTGIPILGLTNTATGLLIAAIEPVVGLNIEDVSGKRELLPWIKESHAARWVAPEYGSPDPNCSSSLNLVMGLGAKNSAQEDISCDEKPTSTGIPSVTPTPTAVPTPSPTPIVTAVPTATPAPTPTPTSVATATRALRRCQLPRLHLHRRQPLFLSRSRLQ